MKVIIGLGNPGEQYKKTRHNAGFMAADAIAEKYNLNWKENKKFKAEVAEAPDLLIVKPQSFMNNSGQSAQAVLSYFNLLPKKMGGLLKIKESDLSEILTVIHDDFDIQFGTYKISTNSRSAGHNGVQSIIDYLKTKNFKRVRIGIRPQSELKIEAADYVMQKFTKEELEKIKNIIEQMSGDILK